MLGFPNSRFPYVFISTVSIPRSPIFKIIHKRTRDTDNFFQYNAPYLSINLSNTINIHPFISLNRFNFFSIFYKQHGFRNKKKSLYDFAKNVAEKHNINFNSIQFICIPSIVGYSFNPIRVCN